MNSSAVSIRRPAGPLFALLVVAVLTGVLGMHALAPGGGVPPSGSAGHDTVMSMAADTAEVGAGCSHEDRGPEHLDHADGSCAAAGIGSAYAPPALTGVRTDALPASPAVATGAASAENGRAPPDLAELQLLRI